MFESMKLIVKKVELLKDKRILIVSDIHGKLDVFKDVLKKANYTDDDYLFILGDIVEKGNKNLETLRYVMELDKKENVFVLMGNNDAIAYYILHDLFLNKIYNYISKRNSLYTEMANELGIEVTKDSNIAEVNKVLRDNYSKELNYLCNLPHIIETDRLLFAHAGIENFENLNDNSVDFVIKTDKFMDVAKISPKLLFVGHYPSLAYSNKIGDYSPKRNFQKRLFLIDGGCTDTKGGQINCLILSSENNIDIDFIYSDDLPKYYVVEDQDGNKDYHLVIYDREKLEVKSYNNGIYNCLIDDSYYINIPEEFIYEKNDKYYCFDYTDRFLDLKKGDEVSLITFYNDDALVKINSTYGWVKKNKIQKIDK